MKTYGKMRWFSEWKPDLSNLGHGLEAGLVSAVLVPVAVKVSGALTKMTPEILVFSIEGAFLLASFFMLAHYWGREKRDCETGMGLPAGSPKAWLFMWWRPKNILDMLGPIAIHALAWVIYVQGVPAWFSLMLRGAGHD